MKIPALFLFFLIIQISAKPSVLILQGRGGTPELDREVKQNCDALKTWYGDRAEVQICSASAAFRNALEHSGTPRVLYLFGHGSANSRRTTLSMTDGRLPVTELAELVKRFPCSEIYLFNTMSAPFLDALATPGRFVLSATDSERQLNPPRYPQFYLQALQQLGYGRAPLEYAALAGKLTQEYYKNNRLALPENACWSDGSEKHSYPFDGQALTSVSITEKPIPSKPLPRRDFPESLQEEATAETLALIQLAKKTAEQYRNFPAFYLKRSVAVLLNPDKTAQIRRRDLLYFRTIAGAERFIPQLLVHPARLIFPDGRFRILKPGPVPTPEPGSILELTRETAVRVSGHLPEFQAEIPVQTILPVAAHEFRTEGAVKLYKAKLYHLENQQLAPFHPEAGAVGKPARIVITSLHSWEDFLAWSRRMMNRALVLDDAAKAKTAQLLQGAASDREKIRRIYDYLNSLRYVTTPLGAAAFRPQTAGMMMRNGFGDCKDKASALAAMCAYAGIRAERVLVNRGGNIDPDFPSWQFNHMINYIPSLNLWLDATDGLSPFGDLPPGDHGTSGLSLDAGSVRFRKVKTASKMSRFVRKIEKKENGIVEVQTGRSGIFDYAFQAARNTLGSSFLSSLADEALPLAEYKSGRIELKPDGSLHVFTAENPVRFTLPAELLKPFSAQTATRPHKLFDGRNWEFILNITGFPLQKKTIERKTARCKFRFDSDGAIALLVISGNSTSSVSPDEYSAIRGYLREFQRELNRLPKGVLK